MVVGLPKKRELLRGKYGKFHRGEELGIEIFCTLTNSKMSGGEENLDDFEKQEKHASCGLI